LKAYSTDLLKKWSIKFSASAKFHILYSYSGKDNLTLDEALRRYPVSLTSFGKILLKAI
jgi:hypothetical protein